MDELMASVGRDNARVNLVLLLLVHLDGLDQTRDQLLLRHCHWQAVMTCWFLSFLRRAFAGFVSPNPGVPPLFYYFVFDNEHRAILPKSRGDRMAYRSKPRKVRKD